MPTAEYASPSIPSRSLRPALFSAGAAVFLLLLFSGIMAYFNFCWLWKRIWLLAASVLLFGPAPAVTGHLTVKYIIRAHHLWMET